MIVGVFAASYVIGKVNHESEQGLIDFLAFPDTRCCSFAKHFSRIF